MKIIYIYIYIYIWYLYISPPNRKGSKDSLTTLNEELIFFNKKGVALVQGDLNARTGTEKDFIEHDKYDQKS